MNGTNGEAHFKSAGMQASVVWHTDEQKKQADFFKLLSFIHGMNMRPEIGRFPVLDQVGTLCLFDHGATGAEIF